MESISKTPRVAVRAPVLTPAAPHGSDLNAAPVVVASAPFVATTADGDRSPSTSRRPEYRRSRRTPQQEAARFLAARLSAEPSEREIHDVAGAAAEAYPMGGNRLARFVFHLLRGRGPVLRTRVRERAKELIAAGIPTSATAGPYCSAAAAGADLGIGTALIHRMLKSREGRHGLGWPVHVGRSVFRIPRAAVSPDTRAVYLASLPPDEPAHPVPLPEGYQS